MAETGAGAVDAGGALVSLWARTSVSGASGEGVEPVSARGWTAGAWWRQRALRVGPGRQWGWVFDRLCFGLERLFFKKGIGFH